ncbi:MAG: hypothetical protein Kow0099_18580 [Candidatus Abyssubacteria bacterium]
MKLKLALTSFLCMALVIMSGCSTIQRNTAADTEAGGENIATGIPLAPDFRIADIPVPAGFEFDREHSFVFQNGVIDVGSIQYVGKEDITDVAQFYVDEMPRYNWTLLNVAEHQTVTMTFDKPEKACQVLLSPKPVRGTVIHISFYPKQSVSEQARY